ncbi:Pimeloyl-ACP methyl ester carboxylesterase [Pasteurella testudinis DSM 23072]|uniref:Pimeloyl-ACP methyl ester carboxylesterase n=1 Tax=Pasteurella testudinis DSM 23072 TaxID=1122938 RepID=A0A1W1V6L5_9PAST|nr:alpha/beta hydrolase [Pasteurella testudinis]SMB89057.1 Pimeloyl-ACP methyl ester carboxylesterase [Pasteurella testudinis DSM 23072]SUB50214.1 Predicted esterase of the alpha/beta hydrolase fold [Pasteurella testudinis]
MLYFSLKQVFFGALAALALAAPLSHAQTTPDKAGDSMKAIKNIVLVHGAFADGSSWAAVTARLQAAGFRVTAVQNPLTSLADDVAATERVLARQDGDVLLVGHSWGGAVITQAGNHEKVKKLVYVSALVPDSGESVADLLERLNAPMEGLQPDSAGWLWLDNAAAYQQVMANDLSESAVRALVAVQQPMRAAAFGDKVTQAAWRGKPSAYVLTEQDHALAPTVQQRLAAQINARVSRINASHLSLLSQPDAVAAAIQAAAQE